MSLQNIPKGKHTILVIDHDASEQYKALAKSCDDYSFVHTDSQKQACDLFRHNEIDIVILDNLPENPCIEHLKFFKSTKPSIPVIITTAFGSEELAIEVFRNGAWDYFRKPFAIDKLRASIKTVMELKYSVGGNEPESCSKGLSRAIKYINEHFSSGLRLFEIAHEANMSISCFEKIFKKNMGMTFTLYVNRLRIARAVKLLNKDGLSMSDIAFACGFTNQFHFTRMFKKIVGISPRDYRKSLKK